MPRGPDDHEREALPSSPDLDLVEYVVMTTSDLASTTSVARAIRELVESGQITILDLVGVEVDTAGGYVAIEPEELAALTDLMNADGRVGGLLSDDDIALACGAMSPGTAALIMVAEDRWARPLADAVRATGGRVVGGERLPRRRLEQSMRSNEWRSTEGGE